MHSEECGSGVQIRAAEKSDAAAIASILRAAFAEFEPVYTPGGFAATVLPSEKICGRWEEGPVWVAVLDGKIVGTAAAFIEGDSCKIRSMAVLPEARGKFIGVLLLDHATEFGRKNECSRLRLSTTPFLKRAIKLYEGYGFFRTTEGPHDLSGTPLFTMEKMLVGE